MVVEADFINPTALQKREREYGVPSDTPNEQTGQNPHKTHSGTRRSEGQNEGGHEDWGTITERECRRSDNILASVDIRQSRREIGSLGPPSFPWMLHRKPHRDSVLSRQYWMSS